MIDYLIRRGARARGRVRRTPSGVRAQIQPGCRGPGSRRRRRRAARRGEGGGGAERGGKKAKTRKGEKGEGGGGGGGGELSAARRGVAHGAARRCLGGRGRGVVGVAWRGGAFPSLLCFGRSLSRAVSAAAATGGVSLSFAFSTSPRAEAEEAEDEAEAEAGRRK